MKRTATEYYNRGARREGGCPLVDLRFDTISGCDWYCAKCGARHHDACKIPTSFMHGVFDPAEFD